MDTHDSGPRRLLKQQSGVITRRQLVSLGASPADLERMVRRRDLARVLPGIYLDHTGSPTWRQRAWAGVLCTDGGVLAGGSALRAAAGEEWRRTSARAPIEVAVPRKSWRPQHPGYRFRHRSGLLEDARWNVSPPRLRIESAVFDVLGRTTGDLDRVALLTDSVQTGLTTAAKLISTLDAQARLPGRDLVRQVLTDLESGACSVLEWAYRKRVTRDHGLPQGVAQVPSTAGGILAIRDVLLTDLDLAVELDGRAFHSGAEQLDADLERDLHARVEERLTTIRLGYGQVVGRPCQTAGALARLMRSRGWTGSLVACGEACTAEDPTHQVRRDLGAAH